jgi:hypothetical protein
VVGLVGLCTDLYCVWITNRDSAFNEPYQQPTHIMWDPCRFGGRRPYFCCTAYERRVTKLYRVERFWRCRHCARLLYPTQRKTALERARDRAQALRVRLNSTGQHVCAFDLPPKPKGMWRRTYLRRCEEIEEADLAREHQFNLTLTGPLRFAARRRRKRVRQPS